MSRVYRYGQRRPCAPLTAALLLIACIDVAIAQPATGGSPPPGLDNAELYLLNVHAAGRMRGDSLPAYAQGETFFIELGTLVASVEFPITRSDAAWSGWFFSEDRRFSWQMDTGIAEIAGRGPEAVDGASWFEAAGEVFVAEPLLEHWFGIRLKVDPRQQILRVSADESLPFELWRERTLAKYRHRGSQKFEPDVVVPDQYNWVTPPLVNFHSQIAVRDDGLERTTSRTTSIAAGMDLLKHSVTFSGAYSQDSGAASDPTDGTRRLTVERFARTPHTPIFGDIHHYAFGDIFPTNFNLVTAANIGRGFVLNRYPDSRAGNLSTVTIADNATPGWEVELYRNGTLVDFATVGPDGRYSFPEQDIYFGENEFLARLYGPQGQVREDSQTLFGGGIELEPGDYNYGISHLDFSRNPLGSQTDHGDALTARYATDLRYSRAVSADLELGSAFTRVGLGTHAEGGPSHGQDFLSLFGRARLGPGVLAGEVVNQLDAGEALSLEYLTGLGGRTLSIAHRIYDDYDSPATRQAQPLDTFTELSVLGTFGPYDSNSYRAGIRHRTLRGGGSDYRLFSRIGTRFGRLSLTNDFEYRVDRGDDLALGSLRLAGRLHGMSIRGQIDYALAGALPIRQVSTSLNWDVSARLSNSFAIGRNFDATGASFASNVVSMRVHNYNLSLIATTDFAQSWSLAAGVTFAFGYDTRQRQFMTDHKSLAHTGRATMNLFIDRNNNGIWDPGESPVHGANYRDGAAKESAPGAVTLMALPSETVMQIDTSRLKFTDPFLVPRLRNYAVQTHAGSDIEIDIAVVMTGDIEGTVLGTDGAPTRGIELTLLDAAGHEIASARSEFDGYYSFTGVPGGAYGIARRGDAGDPEVLESVTLDAERGFVTANDIVLAEQTIRETLP